MGDAQNVYKFINDCLALDLKVDPVVTSSLTAPSAADITEATTAADGAVAKNAAAAAAAAEGLKSNPAAKPENVKETLKLILAELGYSEDKGNGVFVRGKDDDFVALNIATSNYWEIKKRGKPYILFGGKKRKTNRRKHRRSNRKTLGRKK